MSTIARFTLDQYDRMIECGVFDRRERPRLELIRGEIREMTPIGPQHEAAIDWLNEWSLENRPKDRVWVRVQQSITLPKSDSVPEPDIAWVTRQDYSRGRPAARDVLLLIEVADTSLAYDRGEKAELYAEAGITDYWIVNIPAQTIEVHREPREGRYASVQSFRGNQEVRPLAAPEATLRPSDLFASPSDKPAG